MRTRRPSTTKNIDPQPPLKALIKMRIGIDGRELLGRRTGVGQYLAELLKRWAKPPSCNEHEFIVYAPKSNLSLDDSIRSLFESENNSINVRWIPGQPGTYWEQVQLVRAAKHDYLDRFFAPAYSSPLLPPAPTVLTIHDLSFVTHPEWFRPLEGLRRRITVKLSAKIASTILTDSEFSRTQILDSLDVPASRVKVIPPGISKHSRFQQSKLDSDSVQIKSEDPESQKKNKLVLFVGSIFNRRRIPDLIRAFAQLVTTHHDLRLAIVGENRSYPYQDLNYLVETLGIADKVMIQSYVTDAALEEFYSRASVFTFLSEYEGFGLTPLEALAANIPTVVLDTPVAREVYGDAVLFVAPDDLDGTAKAIQALLFEEEVRLRQIHLARRTLARYSWDQSAADTLSALVHTREGLNS